jgi:hypothetical protein
MCGLFYSCSLEMFTRSVYHSFAVMLTAMCVFAVMSTAYVICFLLLCKQLMCNDVHCVHLIPTLRPISSRRKNNKFMLCKLTIIIKLCVLEFSLFASSFVSLACMNIQFIRSLVTTMWCKTRDYLVLRQ